MIETGDELKQLTMDLSHIFVFKMYFKSAILDALPTLMLALIFKMYIKLFKLFCSVGKYCRTPARPRRTFGVPFA